MVSVGPSPVSCDRASVGRRAAAGALLALVGIACGGAPAERPDAAVPQGGDVAVVGASEVDPRSPRPEGASGPVRSAVAASTGAPGPGPFPAPAPAPEPGAEAPPSASGAESADERPEEGGASAGAGVDPPGDDDRGARSGAAAILFSSSVEIGGAAARLVVTREEREGDDEDEVVVLAELSLAERVRVFRQRGFEAHVVCDPPKLVPSPPGITILSTGWCDPWSCGGGCLRTQQVLYIPHGAPAKGRWYELSCNENLSTYPDAQINDACDRLDVSAAEAEIILERTSSTPCADQEDLGRIRRATVRRSRIVMSPEGAELRPGPIEAYREDLWGCDEGS